MLFSFSRHVRLTISRHYSTARTFEQLGIPVQTCQRLRSEFGIDQPTEAQTQFIPAMRSGRDLLLRDRTGTGKTFGLALALTSLKRSLYLAPNEELVSQVRHWIDRLGGSKELQQRLVNTPSQAMDMDLNVNRIILDEADQALRLPRRYATIRQQRLRHEHPKPAQVLIDRLMMNSYNNNKKKPQMIVASATLNRPLRHWLEEKGWTDNPVFIDLVQQQPATRATATTTATTATTTTGALEINPTRHYCLVVSDDEIRNITSPPPAATDDNDDEIQPAPLGFDDLDDRMLGSIATLELVEPASQSMLFVSTSASTALVKKRLAKHKVQCRDIREYVAGQTYTERTLWLATEFSARGMDIPNISHVYILGKPTSIASYLHMAGRTGRLGFRDPQGGKVISLVRDEGWTTKKMLDMFQLMNIPVEHYEYVQ
ncbi:hypothetical protein DFQ28_008304 [Apophysomyces sp. BC1034]|nr:hypothetical protein DFQ30_007163 [Apophysomyces sp. BC1015]KAG0181913.1 hypothetical protein DFQ29_006579 [Apophysomyces sp. BC1021]KAG0192681.1 hypothetical protein DFQ28_008304 [Apophysomyces sp. BC1034]